MGQVRIYNKSIILNEDGADVQKFLDVLYLDEQGLKNLINRKAKEYLLDEGFCAIDYEGESYCTIGMATDTEIDNLKHELDAQISTMDSVEQYANAKGI